MKHSRPFSSYARSNLLIFSVTRFISELGSSVFKFALSLYILDVTGSAAIFSMVLGLSILPGVLVNIFAGVLVDRSDKRKLLVVTELLCGVAAMAFLPIFLLDPTNVQFLAAFSVALSLVQSLTFLTLNASIPNLVERENVNRVNSSYQSIGAIINVVGPMLGAIAYRVLGLEMILTLNVFTYILAGLLQMRLKFRESTEDQRSPGYFDSLKDVFAYIRGQTAIKYLLGIFVAINFILVPLIQVILPYVTYRVMHVSPTQLSVIQGAWSVGVIAGAFLISWQKIHHFIVNKNKIFILIQLQAVLFIAWCFPQLLPSMQGHMWQITSVYVLILAATGLFNSMGNIPMTSYVQLYTPENIRAGIFGVSSSMIMLATPLGIWFYGILSELIHWVVLTIFSGIVVLVIGMAAYKNKQLREFFNRWGTPVLDPAGDKGRATASS
ncbi:MFS transporter [Paenibacillus elgii]